MFEIALTYPVNAVQDWRLEVNLKCPLEIFLLLIRLSLDVDDVYRRSTQNPRRCDLDTLLRTNYLSYQLSFLAAWFVLSVHALLCNRDD